MPHDKHSEDEEDWTCWGWHLFAAIVIFLVLIMLIILTGGAFTKEWRAVVIFLILLIIAFLAVVYFLDHKVFRMLLYVIGVFLLIGIFVALWTWICAERHERSKSK